MEGNGWKQSGKAADLGKVEEEQKLGGEWVMAGKGKKDLSKVWIDTDTEICRRCDQRVNSGQMGLACDACNRWYHADCEKLNKKDYENIRKIGQKMKWHCKGCNAQTKNIEEENAKLREENKELIERNGELEKAVKRLDIKIREMEELFRTMLSEEIKKINSAMVEKIRSSISEVLTTYDRKIEMNKKEIEQIKKEGGGREATQENLQLRKEMDSIRKEIANKGKEEVRKEMGKDKKIVEIESKVEDIERERRKRNIVFYNMQESEESEAERRYREDEEKCGKIFVEELGIQDLKIDKLIRLGKRIEGKNRPLLVKLGTEEEKRSILQRASKLRHSTNFRRVYISRDMTEVERAREKKLREELMAKRRNEEAQFIIRRGKIIKVGTDRKLTSETGPEEAHSNGRENIETGSAQRGDRTQDCFL